MLTKSAKMIIAGVLHAALSSSSYDWIPVVDYSGTTRYFTYSSGGWPTPASSSISFAASSSGIKVGTGGTQPTDDDINLESLITSGLTGTLNITGRSFDANGNPVISMLVGLTNTSDSDITVREMGLFVTIKGGTTSGASSTNSYVIMLDRTVLTNAITIPAGESTSITYELTGIWNAGA